jgi:hypothetical protein
VTAQRRLWTAVGAVSLVALGFTAGAAGSAYSARNQRAEPWKALRLDHRGTDGKTTRTKVTFDNAKLPLQGVEVIRGPSGTPELAKVELRNGGELVARYDEDIRPISLEGPDGSQALFGFKGAKVRVAFVKGDGTELGDKVLEVPVELRSALRVASVERPRGGSMWATLAGVFVGEAFAQDKDNKEKEDESVEVQRDVELRLSIRTPGAKDDTSGTAQVEADCPPFTCLPLTPEVQMPGESVIRIGVTGSAKKSTLDAPDKGALELFKKDAKKERGTADKVIPDVNTVVAVVALTGLACKSMKITLPVCAAGFTKAAAAAAIHGISDYEIKTEGREIDQRALELYYEDEARASLDAQTKIQVCVSREGFARTCTTLDGRPLGENPMPSQSAALDLRKGIGGALAGSFELLQSDGSDCKFSPSPRTKGTLKLSFDNEKGVVTGTMKADEKGTRTSLRCSMGSVAQMRWSQSYTITVTQTFNPTQLTSGGKLPLKLTGTMKGTGGYSFSGCASSGGIAANCPAGKNETYSYAIELNGELDLDKQTGTGRLVVSNAPLSTRGNWRVPAGP